jgi:serine/threonine-protein kinase
MEAAFAPSGGEVQKQLAEILASTLFKRSERLSRFLRFSVTAALDCNEDRVKEYTVGVEVFDRGENFDPRIDPVVRVEARRLRSRLRDWYESEGRNAPILIDLPTGSYLASIRRRSAKDNSNTHPAGEQADNTIAVLPFLNLNDDPQLDYLSDGLTEELIHALTRTHGLHVVAWHSVSKLKGGESDLAAISRRLRVKNVLRGSIRRAGDRVRVTAQLVDVAAGHYLWSEAWDRSLGDLLRIEVEISDAIARKLRPQLCPDEPEVRAPRTVDPAIHALLLKGRFEWNKRTFEGLRLALGYFTQATERAPDWPLAWAALADAWAMMGSYSVVKTTESMPQARVAAERALVLDPKCAEAITCLAAVKAGFDWEWEEGKELYRRAIRLNPSYATAHQWYADQLGVTGQFEEAVAEVDIALTLDPLSSIILDTRGYFLMMWGKLREAEECLLGVLRNDAFFTKSLGSLGRVYVQMGRFDDALACLERLQLTVPDNPQVLGLFGQALALSGRLEEARQVLERLREIGTREYIRPSAYALIHVGLGEDETALDCLAKAVEVREISCSWLGAHPIWNSLRSNPRFQDLLRRVNLKDSVLR